MLCAVMIIVSGQNARRIERILNNQQAEINKGQLSNQIGIALLQDMAAASANSPKMRDLLEKHGFQVSFDPHPGSAPQAPAAP